MNTLKASLLRYSSTRDVKMSMFYINWSLKSVNPTALKTSNCLLFRSEQQHHFLSDQVEQPEVITFKSSLVIWFRIYLHDF